MFFTEHGFNYESVTAADILAGALDSGRFNGLVMPGGQSWTYLKDLGETGATNIRRFIANGGGYMGMCAGAFYAVSNREGGYATGPYGIGLLNGTAYDGTGLGTKPFIEGMMDFDILPGFLTQGFNSVYRIILLGGPSFHYDAPEAQSKHIEVLANFPQINEPAMVVFDYGAGRVFLSGPHLEVEEDRTNWGADYADADSEWPILDRIAHYVTRSR
jgi:glutamine amidotransferase-like uncharacterized protein